MEKVFLELLTLTSGHSDGEDRSGGQGQMTCAIMFFHIQNPLNSFLCVIFFHQKMPTKIN